MGICNTQTKRIVPLTFMRWHFRNFGVLSYYSERNLVHTQIALCNWTPWKDESPLSCFKFVHVQSWPRSEIQNQKGLESLEQPSYKSHKPLKLCNKSCSLRKLKCLFKVACTYMKNSDHIKYPILYSALLIGYLSWMKRTVDLLVERCLRHSRLKLIPQVIKNIKGKISRLKKKKKGSRLCICFSKLVTQKVVWFSNHVFPTPSQINNLYYS